MTKMRKLIRAQITELGDDEVEVVMSTAALARDGHILLPQGCRLENYRANPIVLWSHDPDKPVGNVETISVDGSEIRARVRFAPSGVSQKADETRGLVKSGVIRAVSVGFDPIDGEPLDARKPRGGQRFTDWELLELSFVSVPSDVGALVTARGHGDADMTDWKVGAARNLPIEDADAWDDDAAAESVFAWAGGDDLDQTKARKAFLVYDAELPLERTSYKLPIAHVVDGELKVPKGAIRVAASLLPASDYPDDVKERAQGVLDHYKKEAGMADDEGEVLRAARRPKTRKGGAHAVRDLKVSFTRGLYDVASLCYLFEQLGCQVDWAKWEAAIEGDQSKVPAMLAGVLADLGDALLAMATEEIAEALAGRDVEAGDDAEADVVLVVEERARIAAAKTPAVRAFRRGLAHAKLRGGKTLSDETVRCLREAKAAHQEGMDLHRSAMRKHRAGVGAVDDMLDRAGVSDPENEDVQDVQTSDGVDKSGGSENGRAAPVDFRRRQADLLALAAVD